VGTVDTFLKMARFYSQEHVTKQFNQLVLRNWNEFNIFNEIYL